MTFKVFVYGTLLSEEGNHHLLAGDDAEFLGTDSLDGYVMHSLGLFPAIIPGEGTIQGEVYEISETTLDRLDRLEGTPYFYTRQTATTNEGRKVLVYVFAVPEALRERLVIKNGDWKKRPKNVISG